MSLTELWGSVYYNEYKGGAGWWKRTHCLLFRCKTSLTEDRRCIISPALPLLLSSSAVVRRLQQKNSNAVGGKSAPEARDGWFKVTVAVEVNIKVTAVMPVYFTPQSHPWLCPSFHPRRRGWNVTKLNCSQPPFAASVRHCPGLLSSFQSLSPFSSQAVVEISLWLC